MLKEISANNAVSWNGYPSRGGKPPKAPADRAPGASDSHAPNPLGWLDACGCAAMIAYGLSSPPGAAEGALARHSVMLLAAMMPPLVYLRDAGKTRLSAKTVFGHADSQKIIALATRRDVPLRARAGLLHFLDSLGYRRGLPANRQSREFAEQCSYVCNHLALSALRRG